MDIFSGAGGIIGPLLSTILVLFAVVMTIAWIVLPFAVIGTKSLLRELIAETRRTNALLESAARTRTSVELGPEVGAIRPQK